MLVGETDLVLFEKEAFSSDMRTTWTLFKKGKFIKVLTVSGFRSISDFRRAVSNKLIYLRFDNGCLLYTSPSPRDLSTSRMPSSA